MNVSPLTIRRLKNFRANKRGFYSAFVFSLLFLVSIFAEFIANDKPIFVVFNGHIHFPVFEKIPETERIHNDVIDEHLQNCVLLSTD